MYIVGGVVSTLSMHKLSALELLRNFRAAEVGHVGKSERVGPLIGVASLTSIKGTLAHHAVQEGSGVGLTFRLCLARGFKVVDSGESCGRGAMFRFVGSLATGLGDGKHVETGCGSSNR